VTEKVLICHICVKTVRHLKNSKHSENIYVSSTEKQNFKLINQKWSSGSEEFFFKYI
jgi:hypothetical protein